MIATAIEILLTALVLIGILNEDKLIDLEDKLADRAAQAVAAVIKRRASK